MKCIIIIGAILTMMHCTASSVKTVTPATTRLLGTWFINPSISRLDSLAAYALSNTSIDSMFYTYLKTPTNADSGVIMLQDSSGIQYALGYKAPNGCVGGKRYPLIIYLHGGIGSAKSTKGQDAYNMLSPLCDSMPVFLASPTATRQTPWWSPAGVYRIMQSIRTMTLTYPIDPDKIFLAGVSDGATGCYALANTNFAPFAGFIPISGYGGMLPDVGIPLIPTNLMQRPIFDIHGGNDHLYPIDVTTRFLSWLDSNGVFVQQSLHPSAGHGFDYREKEYGSILAFIRRNSRPNRSSTNITFVAGFPISPERCISWVYHPSLTAYPQMSTFLQNDTLRVVATGLMEVTLMVDTIEHPMKALVVNKEPSRPIKYSDALRTRLQGRITRNYPFLVSTTALIPVKIQ